MPLGILPELLFKKAIENNCINITKLLKQIHSLQLLTAIEV